MRIHGKTRVVGVFADPVEHTLSPQMQNRAFAAMGLPYVYVPWHVPQAHLPEAVAAIRSLNLAGVNVTIPHKVAAMELLDEVTPEARLIGAVNTIENRDGRLIGHNTDAPGFLHSLLEEAQVDPRGRQVCLLGAGGAARAIAVQLLLAGVRGVSLANRTLSRALQLKEILSSLEQEAAVTAVPLDMGLPEFQKELRQADILVNTTSVGMYPHHCGPSFVPGKLLHPNLLVCDIVYTPRRTALLAEAAKVGCPTLPGLGMLAYQGAIAIKIWTGRQAPVQLMKETLEEELAARERVVEATGALEGRTGDET